MISVIVPIYNSFEYLKSCLDSILVQSLSDMEIILVDDGSNDGSSFICDKYAEEDSRIKVIHKENGGPVSARKTGLNAASSDIIGFVDSDDWIEPNMYERLYSRMKEKDVDVVMCGRYEESVNVSRPVYHGIPEGDYFDSDLMNLVYPRMLINEQFFEWGLFPSYWDKLFKRDILEKNLLSVDERIVMGEDSAGVYPCILSAKGISVLHECLYHYRQTPASSVRKVAIDAQLERNRFYILYHSMKREFVQRNCTPDFLEKWKAHVLFLMLPRADVLYDGIWNLEYLFPFPHVKRGDRIIIYGAGLWGKRLYRNLIDTGFCQVIAVADMNYKNLKSEELNIISPEEICKYEFDSIVVPVSYAGTRKSILTTLENKFPKVQIYGLDEDVIFSDKTLHAFGLIQ